jgi:hypothetical protein
MCYKVLFLCQNLEQICLTNGEAILKLNQWFVCLYVICLSYKNYYEWKAEHNCIIYWHIIL